MNDLTDYVLAIRMPGSPAAPPEIKTVELVPGDGDVVSATIAGLRASGLTPADFRSRVIVLVPDGLDCLIPYAALCGFAGRRIDAYAGGVVLPLSRPARDGADIPDAGRPPQHLMWGQVGGPDAEGVPTVRLVSAGQGLVAPEAASVIRYAARLRMVPPDSARAALAMFVLVAALRRRSDDRFPYLSTGHEPVPETKDDPRQGIDLEQIRRAAAQYRQELRAVRLGSEVVAPVPLSPRDRRLAEANEVPIGDLLRRLGSTPADAGRWHCPRPDRHRNRDENPSMKVYGGNRTRCRRCDVEKVGPLKLVIDALGVTPDEAATFILGSARTADAPVP